MPKGATAPGGEAYEQFERRVKLGLFEDKGKLGNQGSQAHTSLLILDGGMPAVHKSYRQDEGMGTTDEVAYKLAQALGMDEVPMTMAISRNKSVQRFVNNSEEWYTYDNKGKLTEEQFDEVMLFDVLIGNTDRHGGNILIHEETGRVSLIDNSYSLANSYMSYISEDYNLGSMRDWVKGWVVSIVDPTTSILGDRSPVTSLTRAEWNDFSSKARSDEVRGIIIDGYGDVKGARVHAEMMERLDIFEDKYGRYIE